MISVGFKTDRGVERAGNEDALFVMPSEQLYIVADGVGGHNSGELASRTVVGFIAQYVAIHPLKNACGPQELRQYFETCVQSANELLYKKAKAENTNTGMATTLLMGYLKDGRVYVVNVGDSRAYLIRDDRIRQITEDHTCIQAMINSGLLTEEEAKKHPDRNVITRAIGGEKQVIPDFFRFDTAPGDILLLCTDGLYGELEPERILELCTSTKTMHRLANRLVEEANERGGKDNISVICIKIQ